MDTCWGTWAVGTLEIARLTSIGTLPGKTDGLNNAVSLDCPTDSANMYVEGLAVAVDPSRIEAC